MTRYIYHIARKHDWNIGVERGIYTGSSEDTRDGFLHFSTNIHIEQSCKLYRKGETDLLLVHVDVEQLTQSAKSGELKWVSLT